MKILVIPDIHGSTHWKNIYLENINKMDRCVFLGDYINSFNDEERGANSILNLKDIVSTTEKYKDKTDLLIGNHDLCHCTFCKAYNSHVSGFEAFCAKTFSDIFYENKDRFKIAVKYGDYVFSHAGFTKTWYENVKMYYKTFQPNTKIPNGVMNVANWMWKSNDCRWLNFDDRSYDPYGDDSMQGPLWVRPKSLVVDAYYKKQIVGHTEVNAEQPLMLKCGSNEVIITDHPSHSMPFFFDTDEDISKKCIVQEVTDLRWTS